MGDDYEVAAGAGTLRETAPGAVTFSHRWTDEGVTVTAAFTGAHLLHLAVAGCVLNDVYREAAVLGIRLDGVRVTATGGFESDAWTSTGIAYAVRVDPPGADVEALLARVDAVAEIPRVVRAGARVERRDP